MCDRYSPEHQRLIILAQEGRIIRRDGKYYFISQRGLRMDCLILTPAQAVCLSDLLEWEILLPPVRDWVPVQVNERAL